MSMECELPPPHITDHVNVDGCPLRYEQCGEPHDHPPPSTSSLRHEQSGGPHDPPSPSTSSDFTNKRRKVDVDAENSVPSPSRLDSQVKHVSVVPSPSRLDSQVTHDHLHCHLADIHSVVSPDTAVDTLTKCDNTEPNSHAESAAEIDVNSTHHPAAADEACANLDEATALKWRSCGDAELTVAIASPPTHTDTPLAAADEACANLDEATASKWCSCGGAELSTVTVAIASPPTHTNTPLAAADEARANLDEATASKCCSCGGAELSTVTVAIASPPTHTDTPLAAADEACTNLDEATVLLVRACMDTVPVVCEMPSAAGADKSNCVIEATATQTDTVNLHHHCTATPTNDGAVVVTVDDNHLFSPEAHHRNDCDDSGIYFDVGEGVTPSRAARDCDVRSEDEDEISATRTTLSAMELASLPPVLHFTHTPSVVAPPSAASAARAAAVLAVADAFRLADRVLILAGAGFSAGSLCADGTKLPGKREGARPAS
jgi:hypothetical protein